MEESTMFEIDYEKITLSNGLQVIFHKDNTEPIIAVAILYHVGSNREAKGKTGFAHFFEHMLFQNSENVGKGNFFKLIENAGGTLNGGTWQDGTVYYEVVPKNALERVLWMESDRMGFMINTVTKPVLENEKEVVKNEKRQRVDNQPYGHTNYVIDKALYPDDHPYNWQVIGSMEDLNNAGLDDVKAFYETYYGPNNATLVLAGDFELSEAKQLVKKYFEEIPSRGTNLAPEPQKVEIEKPILLYHEDNFGQLPELILTYPTVDEKHEDYYALSFLGSILASGKRAPLFREVVESRKLAPRVSASNRSMELSGKFRIEVKANSGTNLNLVLEAILAALVAFENNSINPKDIEKIKNAQEIEFYQGISSALNKSFQLAQYNVFRGEPSMLAEEIKALMKVTETDIKRVYLKYIKDRPSVITSFVPKGKKELAVNGSKIADVVVEEMSTEAITQEVLQDTPTEFVKTTSSFDRSLMPSLDPNINIKFPTIWNTELSNKMAVFGIEDHRLPLIEFSLRLHGGMLLDNPDQIGVANLITDIMIEGTKEKTPEELQDRINQLGSNIQMYTSSEYIEIHASTLLRNFDSTIQLVEELLLKPRWDPREFERVKRKTLTDIKQQQSKPTVMAGTIFKKKIYGAHQLANTTLGEAKIVQEITLDQLKIFYQKYFIPNLSSFHIAGAIQMSKVMGALRSIEANWIPGDAVIPERSIPDQPKGNILYLVDVPGAKQSILNIGKLGVQGHDPILNSLSFVNYHLGGNFNSLLNTQLREERGYTYGVGSNWTRRKSPGLFIINTSVHTQATTDSIKIIKENLKTLKSQFTEEDVDKIRDIISFGNARAFETLYQKLSILENIPTYDLDLNYMQQAVSQYDQLNLSDVQQVIAQHMKVDDMIYVVAGDAKTQLDHLKELDFDKVELIETK